MRAVRGAVVAGVLAACPQALAADAMAPAAYDWTGFYIGANAGAAWTDLSSESAYTTPFSPGLGPRLSGRADTTSTSFTGGGIVGYNYQIDRLVLGAEADFNALGADVSGSVGERRNDYKSTASAEVPWFGTIRARAGYAVDSLLIYATGGLAYGKLEASARLVDGTGSPTYFSGSDDEVNWGWTLGAGLEYAVTGNVIVGAEYLYVDLGSMSFNRTDTFGGSERIEADATASVARATLKFKF